jgi:hypothetical protein
MCAGVLTPAALGYILNRDDREQVLARHYVYTQQQRN